MRYEPKPEYAELISTFLRDGRYASAADVLEAALDLLAEQEAARDPNFFGTWGEAELRAEIQKGEDDIAAGRVTQYERPSDHAAKIIERGERRLRTNAIE